MKPDYKNWIPKGMLYSLIAGTLLSLVLLLVFGVFGTGVSGKLRVVLSVVFGIAFVVWQPYEGACYYRITRCPICAYAKKLGVSELMPLFCELDEVMITLQHGILHRKQTLANGGEYCDYFITGNRE